MRRQLPRPVPVNAVWAMDMTFYTDAHGTQHAAIGMLDHGSRLVLCLHTLVKRNSWAMLGHLCIAIAKQGKPQRLRTDNERVFTSWVFTTFLRLAGIDHQRIQTCAPWQNGRMERLFGTLKPLLRQLLIPSKAALQLASKRWTVCWWGIGCAGSAHRPGGRHLCQFAVRMGREQTRLNAGIRAKVRQNSGEKDSSHHV